jgi:hypothetical protein
VIDDVRDLYSLCAQLVTLLSQRRRRTGLEGKMIKAGGDAEPAIDAGVIFCRHVRNSVWFQKSDKLIAPDIEKDVSKVPAFFDVYGVGDDRLEPQNALVELASLVEVERREANMGKPSVIHFCYSSCSDLTALVRRLSTVEYPFVFLYGSAVACCVGDNAIRQAAFRARLVRAREIRGDAAWCVGPTRDNSASSSGTSRWR